MVVLKFTAAVVNAEYSSVDKLIALHKVNFAFEKKKPKLEDIFIICWRVSFVCERAKILSMNLKF